MRLGVRPKRMPSGGKADTVWSGDSKNPLVSDRPGVRTTTLLTLRRGKVVGRVGQQVDELAIGLPA